MERHAALVAFVLNAILLAVFAVIAVLDRDLADRLTRENGAVEWLQIVLFAIAAVCAVRAAIDRWRADASPVFEVLVAAMLVGLMMGEVDLDRVLAGRKIVSKRFLLDAEVWLGWRVLAFLAMVLPAMTLALYALRQRRALLTAIRRVTSESPMRLFIAGMVILGFTETFERSLERTPGLPRYVVEEVLELAVAICFAIAFYAHWRLRRSEEKALALATGT